jgi:C4-dicarboxylate-specific signal transduction histidine kinase
MYPHGYCLSWQPHLLWLHAGADLVTAIAYFTIPALLLVLVRRRQDLQFSWMFVLFGVFILACGGTHVMNLWTLWVPDYLAAGVLKAITALASVGTAVALVPLLPKAVALPGPAQWEAVHQKLRCEITERKEAEQKVLELNAELEQRVRDRTTELETANQHLSLLHGELEQRIRERTRELEQAQAELVSAARHAGMSEIATNVLHNVGNVLNSVNVSANLIGSTVRASEAAGLARAVKLMERPDGDLGRFLNEDPKGRLLPAYLSKLSEALAAEQRVLAGEVETLTASVDHIKQIVVIQQSYAGASSLAEPVPPATLVDDAVRMCADELERHAVTVQRELAAVPVVALDRHRTLMILLNLISNAKDAMRNQPAPRRITLALDRPAPERLRFRVMDCGEGIAPDNLARIFAHGFTTRRDGHGYGLHSCAIAAREMGGALSVHSDGPGRGATFTLELPVPAEGGAR